MGNNNMIKLKTQEIVNLLVAFRIKYPKLAFSLGLARFFISFISSILVQYILIKTTRKLTVEIDK